MKRGMLGFTRREVLWFAVLFISSIVLGVFSLASLISKYYNHSSGTQTEINNYSHDLWNLEEITMYAVNTQRSSLNIIIYSGDQVELKNVLAGTKKNLDSLTAKLSQLKNENRLTKPLRAYIEDAGKDYIRVNADFLKLAVQEEKKSEAANFNVEKMRPALRRFNDFTRHTSQFLTQKIRRIASVPLNIFVQFEFWLLLLVLSPYVYFLTRFLYLLLKMIFWDLFL